MATKYFVHKSALTHTDQKWEHTTSSFSTYDQALTNLYQQMKDHTSNANTECVNCILKNEHGQIFKNEYFERTFEAPKTPEE